MKKYLTSIVFLITDTLSYSQKIHFTDSTNQWIVGVNDYGPPPTYYYQYFSFSGDTILHARTYKVMPGTTYFGYTFFREDTSLHKVFILVNDTDQVYLDYNLNIADTFVYYTNIALVTFRYYVADTGSVIINAARYRTWYYIPVSPTASDFEAYYVVEGVGCTNGPAFIGMPSTGFTRPCLVCFFNNGLKPALSAAVNGAGGCVFDNLSSCELATEQVILTPRINIYPNPTSDEISIDLAEPPASNVQVTIGDITGNVVCISTLTGQHNSISVTGLHNGLYICTIKTGNATVRQKVVVIH